MQTIASTPAAPYYAIIFSSLRTDFDKGYPEMAQGMFDLASRQNGYLDAETARASLGITITYWKDLASVNAWRKNPEHIRALNEGMEKWYRQYTIRIVQVESELNWTTHSP